MKTKTRKIINFVYGPLNANDDMAALNPQKWARESLFRVRNMWVLGENVYRNFSKEVARFGDTVNAHLPAQFDMKRKTGGQPVVTQDAKLKNVPVVMDGWGHVSFVIDDADASLSFKDLFELYMEPATDGIIDGVEYSIMARLYELIGTENAVGKLGGGFSRDVAAEVEEMCDDLKMPIRNVFLGSGAKAAVMKTENLVDADKIGDGGTRLRTASLGSIFGCNYIYASAINRNTNPAKAVNRAVNKAGGYRAGTTTLVMDGAGGAAEVGTFVTIAGDNTPQLVTASGATSLTIKPGLRHDVADDAVISTYGSQATSAAYDEGYVKGMAMAQDAAGYKLKQGNAIAVGGKFNAPLEKSDVTSATTADRTLFPAIAPTAAVGSGDKVGISPEGGYGFCFDPRAIALVTRPLAKPATRFVESYVTNYEGFGLRVTKTYDGVNQGTRMTIDFLYGTKIINDQLGFMVYT